MITIATIILPHLNLTLTFLTFTDPITATAIDTAIDTATVAVYYYYFYYYCY